VLTIHDVLPLVMPEQYGERYVRIARHQAAAAPHVDAIVTTCEATAAAIVDVLGVERARIAVAPIGHRESAADRRPSPPGPYLLAVGALTPRKGFVDLATAVGRLAPGHPPLLIAGPDGWKADEVRAAIAALGLGDRVQLLGPVSDQELDALYRGALVACHPSHAEGFGMPALEAMHFAVPLVAADIPPVREICAGTQVLVPPGDVDGLAGALDRLLADPAARQELASAGRRRAEAFSWVAMADAVVDVYRRVT
jgi:glycosyltransferase involved in cell wall biosynthesis